MERARQWRAGGLARRVLTAEWFERPLEEIPEHVSYGLPEWGVTPQTYPSLHRWAVSGRDLFREVPMIPGARRILRRRSSQDRLQGNGLWAVRA
jgi:5' nucleotidase, deoxy (Pyrimidine), cytosolic type C protein (NT5C)